MSCGWGWAGPQPLGGPLSRVDLQAHDKGDFLPYAWTKTHDKGLFAVRFLILRTANNFSTIL
jgi:hypothetical protein